jgi:ribonuclease-3 family protein
MIRKHLISLKLTNVNDLHKRAIKYTSGHAQASIMNFLIEHTLISQDEVDIFKRGRNASGPGRKNIDAKNYHLATGFEALIGHLYLHQIERANEIIDMAITYIEKGDFNGKNSSKESTIQ